VEIERLLHIPMPAANTVDELAWHESAPATVLVNAPDFSDRLIGAGVDIVNNLPFEELSDLLHGSSLEFERIKFIRKLALIGRDSLRFAAQDYPQPAFDDLFTLVRHLGQVCDTSGELDPTQRSLDAISRIQPFNVSVFDPRPFEGLHDSLAARTLDPIIMQRSPSSNPEEFHKARRRFRRVMHISLASQALYGHMPEEFIAAGKALNEHYGKFHKKLLASQESDPQQPPTIN